MDVSKLVGLWFHSHEEDERDRTVYRRDSWDFPRSRAPRSSLRIEEDGTVVFGRPGPADETVSDRGAWKVADDVVTLFAPGGHEVWVVDSLDADRLILRRKTEGEGKDGR
jgi:hypothetical protein